MDEAGNLPARKPILLSVLCSPNRAHSHSSPLAPSGRGWRCRSPAPGGAGVRGRSYDDRELRQVSYVAAAAGAPGLLAPGPGNDEAEGEGRHG